MNRDRGGGGEGAPLGWFLNSRATTFLWPSCYNFSSFQLLLFTEFFPLFTTRMLITVLSLTSGTTHKHWVLHFLRLVSAQAPSAQLLSMPLVLRASCRSPPFSHDSSPPSSVLCPRASVTGGVYHLTGQFSGILLCSCLSSYTFPNLERQFWLFSTHPHHPKFQIS